MAQTGKVVRVTVYPSDYGLQRMAEEAAHGPKVWAVQAKCASQVHAHTHTRKCPHTCMGCTLTLSAVVHRG